ncbi:BMP family ABC transporter substrate-binding protein [Faecalicatena contorta]|uniref:BMP family ABC transporter substrate-binding protein n=1 Tax=Lachnospiraceae TaxID=186803 RepID=UPI001F40AF40|nr:BMP family ABC transporter substrate-binding protein [Faecalicatena contorta]MCF2668361.1 BMP family ABC transporter substrate-binding protein [Faecalicatena contorta]
MAIEEYIKAYKMGKKEYQSRMLRGLKPTLEVLDDILPGKGTLSEVPLGLVQIPVDQIVGTKTYGRSEAFASNFMPILRENTEFAIKWAHLCTAHENEGIREPIKAYEYMNKFYVEEGNKRVSVMKFFGVVSTPAIVTRVVPKRTEEKENKIYYEYMDFYDKTKINYIWFSEEGRFAKLLEAVGKSEDEEWNDEDRLDFNSVYSRFNGEYRARGGEKLSITAGDAFLSFITLYGYEALKDKTTSELKALITKSWEEFKLLEEDKEVDLKMDPGKEKKPILSRLLPISAPKLKVAFIYEKTATSSAWTYAHELGRMHLEQKFPEEVSTIYYDNTTLDNIEERIEDAIQQGCNIVFTTTPSFVPASVKAAIAHPDIRILSCSVNTSHRYIRTYYARMHEAKFLMGAIAGAMAENNKIAYIADYPIYGAIANINAFALGAKMINPRAKVYLEWSTKKEGNVIENIRQLQPMCVSGKDMVIPEEASRYFGLYRLDGEVPHNLAMPLWHWGKFYEQLIQTIMDGTWKYDDNPSTMQAINYWWGMSSGVVDVICSQNLPIGTKRLVDLLKNTICTGEFNPFSGVLYSQEGVVQNNPNKSLTPEEILTMDWLAENVVGSIPKEEELQEASRPVISQQGIDITKG